MRRRTRCEFLRCSEVFHASAARLTLTLHSRKFQARGQGRFVGSAEDSRDLKRARKEGRVGEAMLERRVKLKRCVPGNFVSSIVRYADATSSLQRSLLLSVFSLAPSSFATSHPLASSSYLSSSLLVVVLLYNMCFDSTDFATTSVAHLPPRVAPTASPAS